MITSSFQKIIPLIILISSLNCTSAIAASWENLFNIKVGDVKIKVDLLQGSVKKRIENKNKILTFNLHHNINETKSEVDAYGTYKVNCNTKEAWKLSTNVKIINKTTNQDTAEYKSQTPEKLKDKEHADFIGTIDIMCNKY